MRAGRLLQLLLLLQKGGRFKAKELADHLGVSERTILRDMEELLLSGLPLYSTRGPDGGFELLDTYTRKLPAVPPGLTPQPGKIQRVRVRIAPGALQLALLTGTPLGWRRRPNFQPPPDRPDWIEGSFRFDSADRALRELVALSPHVEILLPTDLREAMVDFTMEVARMHRAAPGG